jgi:hypothetical protein
MVCNSHRPNRPSPLLLLALSGCGSPGDVEVDPGAMGVIDRGEQQAAGDAGAAGALAEDAGGGGIRPGDVPPNGGEAPDEQGADLRDPQGEGAEGQGVEGEGGEDPTPPPRAPREVIMVCGSAPERVVQPTPLHLRPFINDIDQRKIRILALETVNAEPCAGRRGPTLVELDVALDDPEDLGR